jgi:glycosyltransferase involved in cell wall biosynthesis
MSKIFAYGSTPKDGGTFTFYQNLRQGLRQYGWDMRCVTVGKQENAGWDDAFADDGCLRIVPGEADLKRQSMAFAEWCRGSNVSVVMPINSRPIIAALPHLLTNLRIVTRCADSTDEGYRRATYANERISRVVAVTPRHVEDLPKNYAINPEKIALIPHGIDLTPYAKIQRETSEILQIAFVGRLHEQKGILYIPGILHILEKQGIAYHLTIAGSGMHQDILQDKMKTSIQAGRVRFLGTIPREQIPGVLAQADISLFLSHHEGFGFALIEGMAAGCVPVASLLLGVTDFIVENGKTGFLCPVGDVLGFAASIIELQRDRERLHEMGEAAAQAVRERFSQERMATEYARLLDSVMTMAPIGLPPRPWDQFVEPMIDPRRWHSFVPRSFKQFARRVLHRLT